MVLKYKKEYRENIVDIFFDVYFNPPFNFKWLNKNNISKYFVDMENTPNFYGFIFVYENKLIGACLGVINNYFKNNRYRINEIFIKRNYQGKGLGEKFLKETEIILSGENIEIIELSTDENAFSFKFYKKSGYVASLTTKYLIKSIKM